jgi:large subunit ribosomal protein L3
MMTAFFGIKIGQSQQFTEEGKRIPVTFISMEPGIVTRVIDTESQKGYQLAFGQMKHMSKPVAGIMKKAGNEKKPRFLRQVTVESLDETIALGSEVKVSDILSPGDWICVTGISKGKGFSGVVKRHGFHGGPKTHGQSDRWRSPGAIGAGTTPGRVYRGKRMAGRKGNDTVTVSGLRIVSVDSEKHIVTVKGVIPGAKQGIVRIAKEV